MIDKRDSKPRVLIVTPEVTYLPPGMGNGSDYLSAKAGGLADVSAALIHALYEKGADVHVTIPDYRTLFNFHLPNMFKRRSDSVRNKLPGDRLHLAADQIFFYQDSVYSGGDLALKKSLAFQREVLNNVIPHVWPDLIHCNDWMTGLIPAAARRMGIPCLFTVHNIHTYKCPLSVVEDRGIDCKDFWRELFFEWMPDCYESAVAENQVDFLSTGIFSAHFVNTVSPTFLYEVIQGKNGGVPGRIRKELAFKADANCATGILNAPDPSYHPESDKCLPHRYNAESHASARKLNKIELQRRLGLIEDREAPVFFWPSRLDNHQKGCQLLADIMYTVISRYRDLNLEIIFVADGPFKRHFKDIVDFHGFHDRVSISDFDPSLERTAYGASDFVLMPSLYEPCGLPQMIGMRYGVLPVAHDTGGLHDTIRPLSVDRNPDQGNGFLFEVFDSGGLLWAMDEAVRFFKAQENVRNKIITRVMEDSAARFNHSVTAAHYMSLYERMLQRPLEIDSSYGFSDN